MRFGFAIFWISVGCRDKNFTPPSSSEDTGTPNFGDNEANENVDNEESANSGNTNNTPNNEEESQTPDNGNHRDSTDTRDSEQSGAILNPEFIIYTFTRK